MVARHLEPTPVVHSRSLGPATVLKLETMQPTGSFKVRGALVAVARAVEDDPGKPIVTASAGNHGLGVAFAATTYGANATVVVPETASPVKLDALARFDVTLLKHGTSYDDAEAHALDLAARGSTFVSPYNDPDTIAGQGTIALELFDQLPDVRTIVVPIGGGGLISGIGLAATLQPGVRVVGVQAAASPAVKAAIDGEYSIDVQSTLADGLAGNIERGSVTIDLARRLVAEIIDVTEDEIAEGIRFLAREHGLIVEGSGAVGVAALMSGKITAPDDGGVTAVLLTGRNIAPKVLTKLLSEAGSVPHRP